MRPDKNSNCRSCRGNCNTQHPLLRPHPLSFTWVPFVHAGKSFGARSILTNQTWKHTKDTEGP